MLWLAWFALVLPALDQSCLILSSRLPAIGAPSEVEYLADVAVANPLPRDARQTLFGILEEVERGGHLAAAAAGCPREVLTLLVQSLPVIEAAKGEGAMLAAFDRAAEVRHLVDDATSGQLAWAESLVLLLRGRGDPAACGLAGAPRVFVYETGELVARPLACSAGMEGVEVFFHHFFLASACRTRDPEEADLFYVPFYSFCYQNEHIAPGNETAELDRLNLNLVASLAHYHGSAKSRHMFLFPHEFWDFPSWHRCIGTCYTTRQRSLSSALSNRQS